MTRRVSRAGGRIVEVPITFVERASGRSKLNRGVVLEAILYVAAWGLKDRSLPSASRPDGSHRRRSLMASEVLVQAAGPADLPAIAHLFGELARHHGRIQPNNPRYGVPSIALEGAGRKGTGGS